MSIFKQTRGFGTPFEEYRRQQLKLASKGLGMQPMAHMVTDVAKALADDDDDDTPAGALPPAPPPPPKGKIEFVKNSKA